MLKSVVKFGLSAAVLSSALTFTAPVVASSDVEELAKKNVCTACHGIDTKLVGPAYKDVAAKYADDPDALNKVKANIKAGGAGKWGNIPMPPQPQLNDEQLTQLANWILSMK